MGISQHRHHSIRHVGARCTTLKVTLDSQSERCLSPFVHVFPKDGRMGGANGDFPKFMIVQVSVYFSTAPYVGIPFITGPYLIFPILGTAV